MASSRAAAFGDGDYVLLDRTTNPNGGEYLVAGQTVNKKEE